MQELRPCSGCRRHIDARERVCPFCGVFGRLSRAGAIAGLTLATATACGGTKPKTEPPPIDNQQQQSQTTIDAGVETETPPDPDLDADGYDRRLHRGNNGNAKMPYGAPPRARRIV